MIIDLDAHQGIHVVTLITTNFYVGNGHERDMVGVSDVYIVDFYNAYIYPNDLAARRRIDVEVLDHRLSLLLLLTRLGETGAVHWR